jgi:4-amino-4-deoxy-L-arabinose transferase-like glycosyltransferase
MDIFKGDSLMRKECSKYDVQVLAVIILLSFMLKMILIVRYENFLTLSSDDLNYIKSAAALVKRGIFTFHQYNEPTVFITPLYPIFLAIIFKVFGTGLPGLQAVRVIQAILSSVSIVYVFFISKELFNPKIALTASFFVAFYIPNIVTSGYILTETLFIFLFYVLLYYSLKFAEESSVVKFSFLGVLWGAASLCRPAISLFPLFLFLHVWFLKKVEYKKIFKLAFSMVLSFAIIMLPWWIRNFREYGEFIPLAASGGNPMLQGTYIGYQQTPSNTVYYKLGGNSLETNKTEMKVAKERIIHGFREDFWGYLRWFTLGKSYYFWLTIFYWKEYFGIGQGPVLVYHYFLLTGLVGAALLLFKRSARYMLPVSMILYFNGIHCVYMAFDRYALPVMPLVSIFCAYLIWEITGHPFSGIQGAQDSPLESPAHQGVEGYRLFSRTCLLQI